MERIRIEVSWDAPDGTLEDLENEGGDVSLAQAGVAAAEAYRDGADNNCTVDSYKEEV